MKKTHSNLLYAASMAAAVSGAFQPRTVQGVYTADNMMTFDHQTVDSAGVFLLGELERLDQTLNMPLADVSWSRDIMLREDVTIGDESASFTNSSFAAAGGPLAGKNWIGKDATAIKGMALDIGKTQQPLALWGMELGWTIPELASAARAGRPVDSQKVEGMELKRMMDIDEMVYIGDTVLDQTGLLNSDAVDLENVDNGDWENPATTPDEILADVNALLYRAWLNSGFAITPSKLLLPPLKFGVLVTRKVSDAGNVSILEYVRQNCIAMANNGKPLDIKPVKWLTGRGVSGVDRMVAYTNDKKRVRYPLVPVQRTPLEYRGLKQLTTYFCRLGVVEWVYPETGAYADGI